MILLTKETCFLTFMAIILIAKSSRRRYSLTKSVLKSSAKSAGKHLFRSLLFNKVAGWTRSALLKKRLWQRFFSLNFAKFLRAPFYRTFPRDCFWRAVLVIAITISAVMITINVIQTVTHIDI